MTRFIISEDNMLAKTWKINGIYWKILHSVYTNNHNMTKQKTSVSDPQLLNLSISQEQFEQNPFLVQDFIRSQFTRLMSSRIPAPVIFTILLTFEKFWMDVAEIIWGKIWHEIILDLRVITKSSN